MKNRRWRLARKIVFLSLIVLLGIFTALSGRFVLSVRPPSGNPTLENAWNNPGQNRQSAASVNSPGIGFNPVAAEPEATMTKSPPATGQVSAGSAAEPGPASNEIYYFLLAGFDAAYANTDTILLTGLNITDKTIHVLNIPRDTMSGSDRFNRKISAAWEQGGILQLEKEVADLTGIMVNRFILTTLEGMEKMLLALGGVEALQLARYGSGYRGGDSGHTSTQQELIATIATQTLRSADMGKLAELAGLAQKHFETDLTMGEILWLAETLKNISFEDIRFYALPGRFGTVDGLSYWLPDKEAIAALMQEFR